MPTMSLTNLLVCITIFSTQAGKKKMHKIVNWKRCEEEIT